MLNWPKRLIVPCVIRYGRRIEEKRFRGKPIIIGACPRSGTTILLSILGAHGNLFAIPNQTYAFDRWEERIEEETGMVRYFPTRLDRLYKEFILNRIPPTAVRWCEKTPKHIRSFRKILNYYDDEVRLINLVRDGRDVVTSKHPRHRPNTYWVPVSRWISDVKLGIELDDHPSVRTFRYEDLIADYESEITKICAFIEEPVSESLFSFIQHAEVKRSKHLANPVENLHTRSIERWRRPEHRRRIDEFMQSAEAVELLGRLGYG